MQSILDKINNTKDEVGKNYYQLVQYSKLRNVDSIEKYLNTIDESKDLSKIKKARYSYLKGYYYKIIDADSLEHKQYEKALKQAENINDTLTQLHALSGLSQSWDYNENLPYRADYLKALSKKAIEFDNNSFKIIHDYLLGNYHLFRDDTKNSAIAYNNVLTSNFTERDSTILLSTYNSIGALYRTVIEDNDSAIYYYNRKLDLIKKSEKFGFPRNYFSTYSNLASAHFGKGNFSKAKEYSELAKQYNTTENIIFNKVTINESLAQINDSLKDYESAYHNLKEYIKFSDSLKADEHREGIARIQEEFDNEKLRADNLETNLKRKQNRNIAIGLGGGLTAVAIIGLLVYKNTRRKQRIAEQEKELEIRKKEKILKDQELTTIDAMIAGQEKERIRLAGDLHDSVGATLAAAKLQFDHLHKNKENASNLEDLFIKTRSLLDDAYIEVRSMAHTKNSGVIAKNGLLPAIEKLAKNSSIGSNLEIQVNHFGLEDRLENSLEIAVFRIIQELVTNIIKHAEASEANISITQHEDSLNLIIEDNGKGFRPLQLKKDGIGLENVEKRIEHMEGTMEIDSSPGKGTSVLIDIPL